MTKTKTYSLALSIILLLAFIFRTVNISQYPMYGDELTLAYDAYSILLTGHDQTGQFMPFTFRMAGGHPPGYVYFSIPFVAIFGPSELGIRMLSIISGLGMVLLVYLLGKKLINEKAGLFISFLASISPWDIHLSRIGFETHFALFLTTLGVYFFLVAMSKPRFLSVSALSLGLAIHTYSTYKLTVPLIIVLLIWFVRNKKAWIVQNKLKQLYFALVIILISVVLIIIQAFFSNSETRFLNINVFSNPEYRNQVSQKINVERSVTNIGEPFASIFHNKFVEYLVIIKSNYLKHLSTDFLFLEGDRNPRHNGANIGELYLIEFLFIIIGLVYFAKNDLRIFKFLGIWILLAPIPTALISGPHALRSSLMLTPLLIISGAGFYYLWEILSDKKTMIFKILISAVLIFELIYFINRHYYLSSNLYQNFFSYSAKLTSIEAVKNKKNYDYILISDKIDSIEIGYPVYAKLEPKIVISENKKRSGLNGANLKKFDNVYIGYISPSELESFVKSLNGSVLYFGAPEDKAYLGGVEIINSPDNSTAVVIKEFSVNN